MGQTIYYYIDSEHKDLIDYIPKEGEIPNSGNFNERNEDEEEDTISRLEKELKD